MSFEVLPRIEVVDLSSLELERPAVKVADDEVEKALGQLVEGNVAFEPKDGDAETGDRVTLDFVGRIDGEAFEGGSAEGAQIVLGRGQFIPGFEEGLTGVSAGDENQIEVTFPEDYGAQHLAGKPATFDVKVTEVAAPRRPEVNDEFAKTLGFDDEAKLREAVRAQLQGQYDGASRSKLKRALLDALNERHTFDLPPTLVENEFEAIWRQILQDLKAANRTFEDENTTEDKVRAEYREIAERRVRLGLILSEVGQANQVKVADEEVNRSLMERIRQFPGQERQVFDFYRSNPQALAELRAPIYEDKVCDVIFAKATISDREVSREELFADEDDDHIGHDHRHHGHDNDPGHGHEGHVHGPDCDHDHDHPHDHGKA
jgi:trigger factor